MKICKGCRAEKPKADYPINRRNPDGLDIRCKPCCAEKTREWRARRPEAARESERRWRESNPEAASAVRKRAMTRYIARNSEEWRRKAADWRRKNPEQVKAARDAYRRRNLEKDAEKSARRRAQVKAAVPVWLSREQRNAMAAIYRASKLLSEQTGILHHVDHIVPLGGDSVCGLHVPWNLRVIPAAENHRKGNRLLSS